MMQRSAIVLGATGLTGRHLVERLVADDRYGEVRLFSRRSSDHPSPKIREYIGDILQLEQFREDFTADVVFCCVGTTSSKTRDRNIYRGIDFGIPCPIEAATIASAMIQLDQVRPDLNIVHSARIQEFENG